MVDKLKEKKAQPTSVLEEQEVTPCSASELAEMRQKFQPYSTFKEE